MRCPRCGEDRLSVVDSRADGAAIRRRRECQRCEHRFTTYERIEQTLPLVVKKDGRRESFDRAKVRVGIVRACEKRPVTAETVERMVDAVERGLVERNLKEVDSRDVGEQVMAVLRDTDPIAYVRFASVYREFSEVGQFIDTLNTLGPAGRRGGGR